VYHAVITMGEHRKAIADNDLKRMVERLRSGQPAGAPGQETVGYGHGV
jgi:hypothetical protein